MTALCDRKSSEHWKSPSAFFSPEQDVQKLHSRSNQNKQHYSSSRKILPATPTEHNQSQRDSSAKSGLYRRSDSSVSPTGSD
ncbi:afadin- and alpha-actinin-binding protein B-like [Bombina bombina]|uniref:afadin- and alpha-actinin-binding protein B-like n=1 Tax=Bombina bombina TaxID=8345 RepID=UPI00235A930B|nr:afadin- and alpha-actinin-binding protein B-like [Bombina bombina]